MCRRLVDLVAWPHLDDLAEVHHRDAIRDVADDREIVRDEEIRELELPLEIRKQVDDLSLNRDVERRHRLVEHDEVRVEGERAGKADSLSLSSRELVREAVSVLRAQSDDAQQLVDAGFPS